MKHKSSGAVKYVADKSMTVGVWHMYPGLQLHSGKLESTVSNIFGNRPGSQPPIGLLQWSANGGQGAKSGPRTGVVWPPGRAVSERTVFI